MAVAVTGTTSELAGYQVEQGPGLLQLRRYGVGDRPCKGGDRILRRVDVVGLVLRDVRLVQVLDPVGLLVDE